MAVRFTASSQTYQATPGLGNQSAMTMCGWGRIVTDRNTNSTFFAADDNASKSLMFQTTADGVTPLLYDDTTGTSIELSALTVGVWYFLAFTLSGTTATMYARAITDTAFSTNSLGGLGARSLNRIDLGNNRYTEWLNGNLEAVKVCTAALTADELWAESMQNQPVRTSGLVAWYPQVNSETIDRSGNGATLTGGASSTTEAGPPIAWSNQRSARRAIVVTDGTTGALAGTLPEIVGSFAATTITDGALAGTLPAPVGAFAGDVGVPGALAGELPVPVGALVADTYIVGALDGQLPAPTASITAGAAIEGSLAGTLPAATAQLVAAARTPPLLAGDPVQQRALYAGSLAQPRALYVGDPVHPVGVRAGTPERT